MCVVAVLGAGDIGGATVQALAARDRVASILLIDAAAGVAAGKALDIQQSGAVDGFHTRIAATDDLTAATTATVCVIADRAGSPAREWDGEEGLAMIGRLRQYATGASIVFAGAQLELMRRAAVELGAPRERLLGSAPEALSSAMRAMVALEARCSPMDVSLAILGTPDEFVVPWSEASIGGYALDRVLSQAQIARVEARTARLWPLGPHTLGAAAAAVADGIVGTSRRSFSVFTLMGGEFGVRDRVGAMPVSLSTRGIADVRVPLLNARERVRVQTALGG